MFALTIAGEPYFCKEADKLLFMWMNITYSRYTIVDKGEFILVDRHFNCLLMTAKQMEACLSSDFRKWRRPDVDPPPPIDNPDSEEDDDAL